MLRVKKRTRVIGGSVAATIVLAAAIVPLSAGPRSREKGRRPGSGEPTTRKTAARRAPDAQDRSAEIRAAIADYLRERSARNATVHPRLKVLGDLAEHHGAETARLAAESYGIALVEGRVPIEVFFADPADAAMAARLEEIGVSLTGAGRSGRRANALVPLDGLGPLAQTEGVVRLDLPRTLRMHAVTSEGVGSSAAPVWQAFDPPPGLPLDRPVKVAVIDGGYQGYQDLLADDLPASVETAVLCSDVTGDGVPDGTIDGCLSFGVSPHGAAVAEVIHDMAPEADLLLVTIDLMVEALERWEEALDLAEAWGADVVSSSLGLVFDDRDGSGALCQTARSLRRGGTAWASSAGNEGDACNHEHYEWTPASPPDDDFQSFPAKQEAILDEFTLYAGQVHLLDLTWDAWNRSSTADFDLLYLCDLGVGYEVIASSEYAQCGIADAYPIESIGIANGGDADFPCAYAVFEFDDVQCPTPSRVRFDVWSLMYSEATGFPSCPSITGGPYLEESTSSYTISHPADCEDVLGAGAYCVHNGATEYFSSRGPTLDDRIKPDFCAPDQTSGATYGLSSSCQGEGFAGTSSSAPHLAGALALLYQKIGGSFTLDQCRSILERRAIDATGDGAPDDECGHGRVCLSARGCP